VVVESGKAIYHMYCGTCHGDSAVSTGVLPDLRYSTYLGDADVFTRIVREGELEQRGMISFGAELSADEVASIRAYVIRRAHESLRADAARAPGSR
jgi:alcohol dehydrogenase (cytochrome c)/quinohemoprotein ethanol dehydrogenase